MGTVFILDLAYAAGIAISPTPVVVVILMLFSPTGRRSALAYLTGWIIGLTFLGIILVFLVNAGLSILEHSSLLARPGVQIILGVGLFFLGWRRWNKPQPTNLAESRPSWMDSIDKLLTQSSDKFTPGRALALAFVMSALSPKNIALMLALLVTISDASLDYYQIVFFLVIFIVFSSVTIGIPILYTLAKGENSQQVLNDWKDLVIQNRGRAIALLLFVLGGISLINGIIGILERNTFR